MAAAILETIHAAEKNRRPDPHPFGLTVRLASDTDDQARAPATTVGPAASARAELDGARPTSQRSVVTMDALARPIRALYDLSHHILATSVEGSDRCRRDHPGPGGRGAVHRVDHGHLCHYKVQALGLLGHPKESPFAAQFERTAASDGADYPRLAALLEELRGWPSRPWRGPGRRVRRSARCPDARRGLAQREEGPRQAPSSSWPGMRRTRHRHHRRDPEGAGPQGHLGTRDRTVDTRGVDAPRSPRESMTRAIIQAAARIATIVSHLGLTT